MLEMIKKSKKLIINIILLIVTSALLVISMLAWYISNTVVTASGITASTDDGLFTLELERGEYNKTAGTWIWTPTTSLTITNMQPDDSFFFRFKIVSTGAGNLNVKLSNITSTIQNDLFELAEDDISVLIGGAKYFELDSNNQVKINNKLLYSYSSGTFSLGEYLVQDTFKYYDYGLGTITFGYDNVVTHCPNYATATALTNISTTYSVSAAGTQYGYFALEFNDVLSLVTYTHLDGVSKADSNLYQAQSLAIKQISVETII